MVFKFSIHISTLLEVEDSFDGRVGVYDVCALYLILASQIILHPLFCNE